MKKLVAALAVSLFPVLSLAAFPDRPIKLIVPWGAGGDTDVIYRTFQQDFQKRLGGTADRVAGSPITRHWVIPQARRPKVYMPHPVMSPDEIRARTQAVWDQFYGLRRIWNRSRCTPTFRARLTFVLISKLYRQMYANTGIATDGARVSRANRWARVIATPCRRLFTAAPLPTLRRPSSPPVAGSLSGHLSGHRRADAV